MSDQWHDVSPDLQARLAAAWNMYRTETEGGYERAQHWNCEDGWYVIYTTTKMKGGPHDGKYAVAAYKPIGKGARTNPTQWKRVYLRSFVKRKDARSRALDIWWQHSPKKRRYPREEYT